MITYRAICYSCFYQLDTEARNVPTLLLLRVADCVLGRHEVEFDVLDSNEPVIEDAQMAHRRLLRYQQSWQ